MKHSMKLDRDPFEKIRSGSKTIELRLYDEKRSLIAPGDIIEFTLKDKPDECFEAQVTALHRFDSFEQLYKSLPLEKCGYSEKDLPSASFHDMEKYYSPEKQAQYGVVGIELEVLNKDILLARKIAGAVAEKGGTAYYVGGFVRDKIRKKENKDVDIEVHGIRPAELEAILDGFGQRISIGESFGIYNIKGYSLDIAMPRKEENRGSGHRDFDVFVDPFIGTEKAAVRRDFTVNALMQNVLTGEVVDWFGGLKDLEDGIIRHINDKTFAEDELRVLRAAQFSARFGYTVADETVELCRKMSLSSLPCERVMGELEKALLKADKPSVFFRVLRSMNQLSNWFPELENIIGIQQNPKHHSEGDVWVHTMMVLDEGARFRNTVKNPLGFMLACLTHDFGKAVCTEVINGEIHSYMHEKKGLPIIKAFMKRLTNEKALTEYVLNLAELHMKPNTLAADKSSIKATNRMFDAALDPEALLCIATADGLGKIAQREYVLYDDFFKERLAIYREYMARPYVMGRDLIEAGLKPSKNFSKYLELAHNLRLSGVDKERVLKQILGEARKAGDIS